MYINNILENKLRIMSSVALIIVPYYTWKSLYQTYKYWKRHYEEKLLFNKRHDCVVMYSSIKGMKGWPPNTERIKINYSKENSLTKLREPVLYFIDTAMKSLDIAFMMINVNDVYNSIMNAHQRGVKIRFLLNFEHCESKLIEIKKLMNAGVEVLTYISQGMNSIMHYKYMVKDYAQSSGFVLIGSLNLTDSGFTNNYEDLVFTSNQYVAKAYHEDFQKCWNFVKADNEDIINKTTLLDANLV